MTLLTKENIEKYFGIKSATHFVEGCGLPVLPLIEEEVKARRELFPNGDVDRVAFEDGLQAMFLRGEIKLSPLQQGYLGLLGDEHGFGEGGEG